MACDTDGELFAAGHRARHFFSQADRVACKVSGLGRGSGGTFRRLRRSRGALVRRSSPCRSCPFFRFTGACPGHCQPETNPKCSRVSLFLERLSPFARQSETVMARTWCGNSLNYNNARWKYRLVTEGSGSDTHYRGNFDNRSHGLTAIQPMEIVSVAVPMLRKRISRFLGYSFSAKTLPLLRSAPVGR